MLQQGQGSEGVGEGEGCAHISNDKPSVFSSRGVGRIFFFREGGRFKRNFGIILGKDFMFWKKKKKKSMF